MDNRPLRTYAVGDIHGRLDLLIEALLWINHEHPKDRGKRLIFLGDYVDRGPKSKKCVELLIDLTRRDWVHCIRGNHEEMMIRAYRGEPPERWFRYGGLETLESYGVQAPTDLPVEHIEWMESLPLAISDDERYYVHAGIMPGYPIENQKEEWLLWMREPFLSANKRDFVEQKHVVHGHTPEWDEKDVRVPELLPHRTNLDTGAYATGLLTIGVFDPGNS